MKADTLQLRPATPDDASAITALTRAAYQKYVPRMGREPEPMTVDYQRIIRDYSAWVGLIDTTLVGVLILKDQPDALLIYSVALAPAFQGRGLGRTLLAHAETQACIRGYDTVRLYTNEHMAENIALYQRLGYRETRREQFGNTQRVFMEKTIN